MRKILIAVLTFGMMAFAHADLPSKTSAAGDSITMGFGADCKGNIWLWDLFCLLGGDQPEHSWFDGWDNDVTSIHDRYKVSDANIKANKNAAKSGSEMRGGDNNFATQAAKMMAQSPVPDHVEVLLGGNDICNRGCTVEGNCNNPLYDDNEWRSSVRAGLDTLMQGMPVGGTVYLGGVPRIQDLRPAGIAKQKGSWTINCKSIWNTFDICSVATDGDKMSGETIDQRRANIAARQQRYNEILAEEAAAYNANSNGTNPKGIEVVADYQGEGVPSAGTTGFGKNDIDGGDCFHPSIRGQNTISSVLWNNNPDK